MLINFFDFQTDAIDSNIQEYNGIDHIQCLLDYIGEYSLGEVEFSVFQCKSKSKISAYYANIKVIFFRFTTLHLIILTTSAPYFMYTRFHLFM